MAKREIAPWWRTGELEDWPSMGFPMANLHREMDRLFERVMGGGRLAAGDDKSGGSLIPEMDISETDKELEVKADLPGMEEKDLDINLADGVLTIKGEKKSEKEDKDKSYHRIERSYGTYFRSIRLPCEVDESKVTAEFSKGVLTVHLPKSEKAKTKVKKIEVKSG